MVTRIAQDDGWQVRVFLPRSAPWPIFLLAGAVCAELLLPVVPHGDGLTMVRVAAVAAKTTIGCWIGYALVRCGAAMVSGQPWHVPARLRRHSPWVGLALAGVLLTALLLHTPSRLTLSLLGLTAVGLPLIWVVERAAGRETAWYTVLALALLAVGSTGVDVRRPPSIEEARADSPFRWAVGWPTEAWRLRHEIVLDQPLEARPMVVDFMLAHAYVGRAQVFAALNGQELGAGRIAGSALEFALPASMIAGQTKLTFVLRQVPPDPNLRLLAFRVARGATLGQRASSYYDGSTWWPGTFNDEAGHPQAGIYVVDLRYA